MGGEIEAAAPLEPTLARGLEQAKATLRTQTREAEARRLTEALAILLQGALLLRSGVPSVGEAFCHARVGHGSGSSYGTLPMEIDRDLLLERASATNPAS